MRLTVGSQIGDMRVKVCKRDRVARRPDKRECDKRQKDRQKAGLAHGFSPGGVGAFCRYVLLMAIEQRFRQAHSGKVPNT